MRKLSLAWCEPRVQGVGGSNPPSPIFSYSLIRPFCPLLAFFDSCLMDEPEDQGSGIVRRAGGLSAFERHATFYLMNRHIASRGEFLLRLHIERLPEGKYLATTDALPDLLAQGDTLDQAIEFARDVARKLLESYREHGDPIPSSLRPASDRLEVDTAFAL